MTKEKFNIEAPSVDITYGILAVVLGLLLPLLLIPVVKITGYSEIIEEIFKVLVIFFLILKIPRHRTQIIIGIAFGFLFGLSENFLYLNQIFQLGDFHVFSQRFLWTATMHVITVLVMIFSGLVGRAYLVFGFIGAVVIHLLFNSVVVNLLLK
jgi:RsiW-degrading membrane proteinase PrsW (M82 family)